MSRPWVLFAGGGTGGHLFPGLAIAERAREMIPDVGVLFLCSDRAIDEKILAGTGVERLALPARPVSSSPVGMARCIGSWGPSVRAARGEIRKHSPRCVLVALGGFVAAPAARAARAERRSVVMVNLDAAPGLANRWIARGADVRLTAASVADRFRWRRVGPIVRSAAMAHGPREACAARLGLDPARRTLTVTGASQGARSINQFALAFARAHADELRSSWQIFHQTGDADRAEAESAYSALGIPARVVAFHEAMGDAWGAADVAVARCGAGCVAEVWANRVPTLFLPYPYHKDQHQRLNAEVVCARGGAILGVDAIDPAANLSTLGPQLLTLLREEGRRDAMRQSLAALGPADGAHEVAQVLRETLS